MEEKSNDDQANSESTASPSLQVPQPVNPAKRAPKIVEGPPRFTVVGLQLVAAAIVYGLQLNGSLDKLTAEYYVSDLDVKAGFFGKSKVADRLVAMQEAGNFPSIGQISNSVVLAAVLSVTRVGLTDFVFVPIGSFLMGLDKIKGKHTRRIILDRFSESCWRLMLYSCSVGVGVYALYDKPWNFIVSGSSRACWEGWPTQEMSVEMKYFYTLALGTYIHLFFFHFVDVRRKDFSEMLLHHVLTIGLITTSWVTNFVRFGSLVLMVHDPVDVLLESSKLWNYIHTYSGSRAAGIMADLYFFFFAGFFVFSRLYILPVYIIWASTYEVLQFPLDAIIVLRPVYLYWIMNSLLIMIQILHIFWSMMILGTLWNKFTAGELRDIRDKMSPPQSPLIKGLPQQASLKKDE